MRAHPRRPNPLLYKELGVFLFLLKFRLDFDDIYSIMINVRPAPQPDGSDYQTRQTAMRKAVAPQQDLSFF